MNDFNNYIEFLHPQKLSNIINSQDLGNKLLKHSNAWIARFSNKIYATSNLFTENNLVSYWKCNQLSDYFLQCLSNPIKAQKTNNTSLSFTELDSIDDLPFFSLSDLPLAQYLTSSIVVARNNKNINLSYHRIQKYGKNFVIRVVKRHLWELMQKQQPLKATILFGVSPGMALAAAYPLNQPGGELDLASTLNKKSIKYSIIDDFIIPLDFQVAVLGEFNGETALEGPFIDITGTIDPARKQPVFKIHKILSLQNPIFPVILPSSLEHRFLMGFSKKISIIKSITPMLKSLRDVNLTSGGSGWLHTVVSCTPKSSPFEIAKVVLSSHTSLKRVIIVNEDIDPYDATQVEWALATRFQPHKDLLILNNQKGSSLDPSSIDNLTSKWILNATYPDNKEKSFKKLI